VELLNTEQQMATAKQELLDDMEVDAELLGVKRKAKGPAGEGAAAAGADASSSEAAAAAAAADGDEMVGGCGSVGLGS